MPLFSADSEKATKANQAAPLIQFERGDPWACTWGSLPTGNPLPEAMYRRLVAGDPHGALAAI